MNLLDRLRGTFAREQGKETPRYVRTAEDVIAELRPVLPIHDELPLVVSNDMCRENRLPPGQVLTQKWPVLHVGAPPPFDAANWRFRIFGMVKEEVELTWDQFHALPKVQLLSDIHCVTHWTKLDNLWEGIQSLELARLVEILPEAKFVMLHGDNGYTANLEIDAFLEPDVIFTNRHNGAFVSPDHGYPLRAVTPQRYLWKGPKWATGIEFVTQNQPGFWELRGYNMRANPWKEERYW